MSGEPEAGFRFATAGLNEEEVAAVVAVLSARLSAEAAAGVPAPRGTARAEPAPWGRLDGGPSWRRDGGGEDRA